MRGVGFLLGEQATKALIRYNRISSRVISARFATMPFDITVIHTYAPTSSSSDDDKESLYSDVEDALTQIRHQLWESTGMAIETNAETPPGICHITQSVHLQHEIRTETESKMDVDITRWCS